MFMPLVANVSDNVNTEWNICNQALYIVRELCGNGHKHSFSMINDPDLVFQLRQVKKHHLVSHSTQLT